MLGKRCAEVLAVAVGAYWLYCLGWGWRRALERLLLFKPGVGRRHLMSPYHDASQCRGHKERDKGPRTLQAS